jgi:hypothetical protein
VLTPTATITAAETIRAFALLEIGGVEPQMRPAAVDRPGDEALHSLVDLGARRRYLAFADTSISIAFSKSSPERVGMPWMYAAWMTVVSAFSAIRRGSRKVGKRALAQLADAQLDRADTGLPVAVAISVALAHPLRTALASAGAAQPIDIRLRQPVRGEVDRRPQECRIGALLQRRPKRDLVVGHHGGPRVQVVFRQPNPTQDHCGGR